MKSDVSCRLRKNFSALLSKPYNTKYIKIMEIVLLEKIRMGKNHVVGDYV